MVTSRAVINIFDSTVMLYEKLNFDMEGSFFFLRHIVDGQSNLKRLANL